jgi:SAM-dependent methyltransferase
MRFCDLPLRADAYRHQPGLVPHFEALDAALLESFRRGAAGDETRAALAKLHDALRERIPRVMAGLADQDEAAAVEALLDLKAELTCLAQRAFVYFWMSQGEFHPAAEAASFLELYKGYLQAFHDTFIDVPESQKEPQNRRYNAITLAISSTDPLLSAIGQAVVNDVASSLVGEVRDPKLSEHVWNEVTTSYYAGKSRFGINVFVESYDSYLRDLLYYFDVSKDFVADAIVERFLRQRSRREPAFRVLEPGAGTGDMLFRILHRLEARAREGRLTAERIDEFHYLGFDLSEEMRERFESRKKESAYAPGPLRNALARAQVVKGNAVERSTWPAEVADGSFDVVALVFMLHHVYPPRRRQLLQSAAASLRRGGTFVFLEGSEEHKWFKLYHDPQDVEALEYFEAFHRIFEDSSVEGVSLAERRFFPTLEVTDLNGNVRTSGWAVASLGTKQP